jgi:hypothetical protein
MGFMDTARLRTTISSAFGGVYGAGPTCSGLCFVESQAAVLAKWMVYMTTILARQRRTRYAT